MANSNPKSRYFREDFDRERNFVAAKPFTYAGQRYAPNDPIDKRDFSVRSLRQLYDMRSIQMDKSLPIPMLGSVPPNVAAVLSRYAAEPQPAPVPRRRPVTAPPPVSPAPTPRRRLRLQEA